MPVELCIVDRQRRKFVMNINIEFPTRYVWLIPINNPKMAFLEVVYYDL